MPAVVYPPTLPGPSPGSLRPRSRKAGSGTDGPLQLRSRQRDFAGAVSQYPFFYSPSEMATWRQWYESDLLQGRRWFAIDLPGRNGIVERVARFVKVEQKLLESGNYRVDAALEQRGPSDLPEGIERWIERFDLCDLLLYTTVSGNGALFSVVDTEYGCALFADTQSSATASIIRRTTPELVVNSCRADFKLTTTNDNDSVYFQLGLSGTDALYFIPMRHDLGDVLRRPAISVAGEEVLIGSAALSINVWYRMRLSIVPGAGNTVCRIYRHSDWALVASAALASSHSPPVINQLSFVLDDDLDPTGPGYFDNIAVNW
jgi:hypothetical protein